MGQVQAQTQAEPQAQGWWLFSGSLYIFQSMKKIVSAVRESIFVAILQEDETSGKRGKIQRRLLIMLGVQLALSILLILLLILGWPSILKMRWGDTGVSAEQRLGEVPDMRSELKNRTTPKQESGDLTLQKSIWMVTFNKIRSEIANRIKTTNKRIPTSQKETQLLRFGLHLGKRGSRAPILVITRKMRMAEKRVMKKKKKEQVENMLEEILKRIYIKNQYARLH